MSHPHTIGGFIGQATKELQNANSYHKTLAFTTGRSCLNFIIQQTHVKRIHLPYYICDSVILPIIENNIQYKFYNIDENLEIIHPEMVLKKNEMLFYVNYFGLKSKYAKKLQKKYKENFILDNSQAFFHKGFKLCWAFNSARKFFGVADGAFLYTPHNKFFQVNYKFAYYDVSYLKLRNSNNAIQAYDKYIKHEKNLTCDIKYISDISMSALKHIDFKTNSVTRLENFKYLDKHLNSFNLLKMGFSQTTKQTPLYYPFLVAENLRPLLIKKNIFIPLLWAEVINREESGFLWEKFIAKNLILLPIDQRYSIKDMQYLLTSLKRVYAPLRE